MQFRDLNRQYLNMKDEIDCSINKVLSDCNFINGNQVNELEDKLAEYVGVKHCITCGNGTDALTIALMTWGIGEGDAVFVPDFTFFSSGECPAGLGAIPVFVDVEKNTYNIDPDKLENAIIDVIKEKKITPKVVISVDLFGLPANYVKIKEICNKYKLLLLEDGAQGFGGTLDEKKACSFGDISTTSFFPAKPLGCYGDGGAIFTDNDEWAELIRSYCVHGKNKDDKYDNVRLGMNSRLDTIQAAILIPKLKAFIEYELKNVNNIAKMYNEKLADFNINLPVIQNSYKSSWAQYTILTPDYVDRNKLQAYLKNENIPSMIYYKKAMHNQSAFNKLKYNDDNYQVTNYLCSHVLSLPMHPYLNENEIERIAVTINKSLKG